VPRRGGTFAALGGQHDCECLDQFTPTVGDSPSRVSRLPAGDQGVGEDGRADGRRQWSVSRRA